ncbi:C40 family peptidase [Algivirga pacifica]|uniref:C40 family peptidase n=2 Tax=Algivirga pacifica TaxID=1162670 RepID=A0ABP9D6V4_9BACT
MGIASCENPQQQVQEEFNTLFSEVKQQYAPDSRLAVLKAEAHVEGNKLILKGETNKPEAHKALLQEMEQWNKEIVDSLRLLPAAELGDKIYGVVNSSVINFRVRPAYSAGMAKQGLLGESLKILDKKRDWYLVQTSDDYLGWANTTTVQTMTPEEYEAWNKADRIIYTEKVGTAQAIPNEKFPMKNALASDLVYGNQLPLLKETAEGFVVAYPDGRTGLVKRSEASKLSEWQKSRNLTTDNLLKTAYSFMGVPYCWGGNSYKGVDCSGFTGQVYAMNGMQLPRDASLQVHEGIAVDTVGNFKNLEVGDLLFFGRRTKEGKEKVVHVGMWIGDQQFIHSQGNVHISSFDKEDTHYDAYNLGRFLRVKRILNND